MHIRCPSNLVNRRKNPLYGKCSNRSFTEISFTGKREAKNPGIPGNFPSRDSRPTALLALCWVSPYFPNSSSFMQNSCSMLGKPLFSTRVSPFTFTVWLMTSITSFSQSPAQGNILSASSRWTAISIPSDLSAVLEPSSTCTTWTATIQLIHR